MVFSMKNSILLCSDGETNERAGLYKLRAISSFLRTISPATQEPSNGLKIKLLLFLVGMFLRPERVLNDKCLITLPEDSGQEERRHFYKHLRTLQWLQFPNEVKPSSGWSVSNLSE